MYNLIRMFKSYFCTGRNLSNLIGLSLSLISRFFCLMNTYGEILYGTHSRNKFMKGDFQLRRFQIFTNAPNSNNRKQSIAASSFLHPTVT